MFPCLHFHDKWFVSSVGLTYRSFRPQPVPKPWFGRGSSTCDCRISTAPLCWLNLFQILGLERQGWFKLAPNQNNVWYNPKCHMSLPQSSLSMWCLQHWWPLNFLRTTLLFYADPKCHHNSLTHGNETSDSTKLFFVLFYQQFPREYLPTNRLRRAAIVFSQLRPLWMCLYKQPRISRIFSSRLESFPSFPQRSVQIHSQTPDFLSRRSGFSPCCLPIRSVNKSTSMCFVSHVAVMIRVDTALMYAHETFCYSTFARWSYPPNTNWRKHNETILWGEAR